MSFRIHYLRLLNEISQKFEEPDWETVREWIEEQVSELRVRGDPFVPVSVGMLSESKDPVLHPGDVVRTTILARDAKFAVPPYCQIDESVLGMGSLHVSEGVTIGGDLLAHDAIHWEGGATSSVRHLVARDIYLSSPPGTIRGGIWCDSLLSADIKGVNLPPDTVIEGVAVVDGASEGTFVVGAHSRLGGLYIEASVETQPQVTISHLQVSGKVELGRNNQIGYVEGTSVTADSNCRLGVLVSNGGVELGKGGVVDTIRAQGDIVLDESVVVTGHTLLSEKGNLYIKPGTGWHTNREHWFYVLPGEVLQPYGDDMPRPPHSKLLVIRTLTHSLWKQIERLSGRL
ncbi:MAG: hypothetical protein ACPGWR_16640 [Ardenticatenaceae bacterium]